MIACKEKSNLNYILGVGEKGKRNLEIQHEMLLKESVKQLKKANITEGMVVWDMACGNGVMTSVLASMVGKSGHVYAFDVSDKQLKLAKKNISSLGYNNVEFIQGDIFKFDASKYSKADLVYSRLFLMHLDAPQKAIQIMHSLLKDNGILLLHESDIRLNDSKYKYSVLRDYYNLVVNYGKINNLNYDIGHKLPTICKELQLFKEIDFYISEYTFLRSRELLLSRYDELKEKAINAGLINETDYLELRKGLHEFFYSDEFMKSNLKLHQYHFLLYK